MSATSDWLNQVLKTFPLIKAIIFKRRAQIEGRLNTAGALMSMQITNFPNSMNQKEQYIELQKKPLLVNKDTLYFDYVSDEGQIVLKSRTNFLLGGGVMISDQEQETCIWVGVVNYNHIPQVINQLIVLSQLIVKKENMKLKNEDNVIKKLKPVSDIIQTLQDFDNSIQKPDYKPSELYAYYVVPELREKTRLNFGISNTEFTQHWNQIQLQRSKEGRISPKLSSSIVKEEKVIQIKQDRIIEFTSKGVVWELQQREVREDLDDDIRRQQQIYELEYLHLQNKIAKDQQYVIVIFISQQYPEFEFIIQKLTVLQELCSQFHFLVCVLELNLNNQIQCSERSHFLFNLNIIADNGIALEELKNTKQINNQGKLQKLDLFDFRCYVFDRNKIQKHKEFLKQQSSSDQPNMQTIGATSNQDPSYFSMDFNEFKGHVCKMGQIQFQEPSQVIFSQTEIIYKGVQYNFIFDNALKINQKTPPKIKILILADFSFAKIAEQIKRICDTLDKRSNYEGIFAPRTLSLLNSSVISKYKFLSTKRVLADEKGLGDSYSQCVAIAQCIETGKVIEKSQDSNLLDWFNQLDSLFNLQPK